MTHIKEIKTGIATAKIAKQKTLTFKQVSDVYFENPTERNFNLFYKTMNKPGMSAATKILKDFEKANIAVNDAFIKLKTQVDTKKYDSSKGTLSTYFFHILKMNCLNELRNQKAKFKLQFKAFDDMSLKKQKKTELASDLDYNMQEEGEATKEERLVTIHRNFEDLRPKLKAVATERFVNGLSIKEIESKLGLTKTSVLQNIHLIKQELKKELVSK